jgi:hypothetical protein
MKTKTLALIFLVISILGFVFLRSWSDPAANPFGYGVISFGSACPTVLPTPSTQGSTIPIALSGSGQQYAWPNGPRDNVSAFSVSTSVTTPVTIATAGTSMFLDIGPSVVHNTSSTSVAFTVKKGTTILWSDISDAGTYTFIPALYCGGTAAQSYIFTLGAAVTQVFWNGSYISNGR